VVVLSQPSAAANCAAKFCVFNSILQHSCMFGCLLRRLLCLSERLA
jgi:hypothetical protein